MNSRDNHTKDAGSIFDLWDEIRRAFAEFLGTPTVVIVAFLLVAAGSYSLDQTEIAGFQALRGVLRRHVFADSKATSDLLGTIAGGIITVTSIIISLLLVALQQSAASLTHQVFDQFLRRRVNQFYFGFFVGLALFALVTLATVTESFNPVFGGYIGISAHHDSALSSTLAVVHDDQPDASGCDHRGYSQPHPGRSAISASPDSQDAAIVVL